MLVVVCVATLALSAPHARGQTADPIIAYIGAQVLDETPTLLAEGGPWQFSATGEWVITNVPAGTNRTVAVALSYATGLALYAGELTGVDVAEEVPGTGVGSLTLRIDPEGIRVLQVAFGVDFGLIALEAVFVPVDVDIKPGSDKNPFNVKSRGVLPVAILGSADLDVTQIARRTLTLAGVAPKRAVVCDVAGADGEVPDGFADLVMHFSTQAIVGKLGSVTNGEVLGLVLAGSLNDGLTIIGSDIVTVQGAINRGKAKGHSKPPKK